MGGYGVLRMRQMTQSTHAHIVLNNLTLLGIDDVKIAGDTLRNSYPASHSRRLSKQRRGVQDDLGCTLNSDELI